MKLNRKYIRTTLLLTGTIALGLATFLAGASGFPGRRGTDILHFFARKAMANTALDTNATGVVFARQNSQGHVDIQSLDITVRALDTNTQYQLLALLNNDTNLVPIGQFTTDSRGRAQLYYRKRDLGNGHVMTPGRGTLALPATVDPLSTLRGIGVFNADTQAVLTADLNMPDVLQYLIKRDLSTDNLAASLQIIANLRQTQFRLTAAGLQPTNAYWLVINGGIVQTNTTDRRGRLFIRSLLTNPVEILDVGSVELWNTSSNVVLSTTLP